MSDSDQKNDGISPADAMLLWWAYDLYFGKKKPPQATDVSGDAPTANPDSSESAEPKT
jgi:hypothetical protein